MSTRCQVIVKDSYSEVWFYRHSDGYPEGVLPTLKKFVSWIRDGKIRNNVDQSAGWLVILGHNEYKVPDEPSIEDRFFGWKVGAYELCEKIEHGDIQYLYTVDVENLTVNCKDIYEKREYTLDIN